MLRVGARIRACTVIERLPLVAPPLQQWEVQWELAVRQKIQWRLSKAPEAISKDLKHFVTTEFLDAFYDGETVTPDDQNNNLKSTNRKLDQTLFLLVKHKNGEWEFPTGDCFAEESLREAAERSVADMFEQNLQVYFTGIAPLAHHQSQDNEDKTFFLRSYLVNGNALANGKFADFVWVTKADLSKYISKTLYESIEPMLDH